MFSSSKRVPMTLRDNFFDDPFFQSAFEDFDGLRKAMTKETKDFWSSVEKEMNTMMSSTSRMAISNESSSSSSDNTSKEIALRDDSGFFPSFFPRRWMLPKVFGDDDDALNNQMRSLDLFQHKDDQVIRLKEDDTKFEVSLDLQNFRPDEIKVNVKKGLLSVEAKHEEKTENSFASRQFSKAYSLPEGCEAERVTSNLSSDGILMITAPKKAAIKASKEATPIPVTHKS